MRAVVIAAFSALALTACSQADRADVKEDVKAVGADVKDSAKKIGDSDAVADLKAEARDAASDTGAVLKKGSNILLLVVGVMPHPRSWISTQPLSPSRKKLIVMSPSLIFPRAAATASIAFFSTLDSAGCTSFGDTSIW